MKKRAKGRRDWRIPAVAWEHVEIECGKASRRFRLNEDESADMRSHIGCQVRMTVAKSYDPSKGCINTFVQRVTHVHLCDWMRKETRRREDVASLAKLQAEREGRIASRASYCGEVFPETQADEEAVWDVEWVRELLLIADVRHVVSQLEEESKRLCELYLETGSLRTTCDRMNIGCKRFFMTVWPKCKAEFVAKSRELRKPFAFERRSAAVSVNGEVSK